MERNTCEYSSLYECINEFGTDRICPNPGIDPVDFVWDKIGEEWTDKQILDEAVKLVIWYYSSTSPKSGGRLLQGNKELDRKHLGEWETIDGKDYVWIDINNEHKSFIDYLPTRLSRFLNVREEYNLLESLQRLGYETEKGTKYDDRVKKIDLYTEIGGKRFAIKVFKNSEYAIRRAKEKAEACTVQIVEPIVEFRFDENRQTTNMQHVAEWVEEVRLEHMNPFNFIDDIF